jgi:F-type H+-transporting ATPase subunit gamma
MASIKDLKKRIGTVKNTQQTTKAMKMVSAAKLRRAQDAILANRPYSLELTSLVGQLAGAVKKGWSSPFFADDSVAATEKKKVLVVVVTSDRGLCAGFNANIIRTAQRYYREHSKTVDLTYAFLGKRGYDFFKTKNVQMGPYFENYGGKVTFQKARELSVYLQNVFLSGQFNEVKFLFNEFKNAVTQQVTFDDYLPVRSVNSSNGGTSELVILKPSAEILLGSLLDKVFVTKVFRIMLDSQAGEHGARMSAMENATKNAGEMIKKLTLQYNKQRQAGITKELLEIISGSESQKQ